MKRLKVRLWAFCLSVMMLISGMPMNALATEQEEKYPYTIYAGKDISFSGNVLNANGSIHANRAIMYQCMNGVINGVSSSAVATYGTNSHVITRNELTGQEAESMVYIGSKLMDVYFTEETRVESMSRIDSNMSFNTNIYSMTNVSIGGNININQAAIGAIQNIEIGTAKSGQSYNVNSNQSVLYSVKGDIVIDVDNFNFSGLIYAPNGDVEIVSRGNLGLQGVIIAQNVNLQGNNINLQSDSTFAQFVAEAIKENNEENDPSKTPEEDSSEDSSEEPSETPEEEIDYTDTDGDGLIDVIETEIGTNPEKTDTDEDGLSDFDETYLTATNPLKKDTDDDGVFDPEEDMDEDGLNALAEMEAGTFPSYADTDCDGLSDGEEGKYSTNPLNPDTDEDGLMDGDEIGIGLNPANPATFGVPDAEYVMLQRVDATSDIFATVNIDENAYSVSVEAKVSGNLSANLIADETGYAAVIANDCMVGMPIELTYDDNCQVEEVTLSFDIKDAYTDNELNYFSDENDPFMYSSELVGIKRLQVFKFFEDGNMLLPIETFHDVETNTVKTVVDEFGVYCLMDMEKWILSLAEQGGEFEAQLAVLSLNAGFEEEYYEWSPEETVGVSVESVDEQPANEEQGDVNEVSEDDSEIVETVEEKLESFDEESVTSEELTEDIEVTPENEEVRNEVAVEDASEDVETESVNEEVTVLRSPVMRSKETNEAPVDVVFLLQIIGTDKSVYDCEIQNIIDVSEKLFETYPNARVSVITFGIDDAQFLGSDSEYWFNDAEELADALYEINYGKTSIYCNRGAAFEIVMEQVNFRPTAAKYVYQVVNGNTSVQSNYFSQLELCKRNNIIYSEVYSPYYAYIDPSYGEMVEAAVEKTQGVIIRTGSTSGEEIWNHLSKYVPTEKVEYKAIIASGWQTITLDAPLDPENGVDTDGDTLLDWDEVDVDNELLVWNADGSVELPTIHECMMSGKPVYVERGLDRIIGAEGIPSDAAGEMVAMMIYTYRIMPINSDPTSVDSDKDEYVDSIDSFPLHTNYIPTYFREYLNANYITYSDLRFSDNGFTICLKSLGEIMQEKGINACGYDGLLENGEEKILLLECWYIYAIEAGEGEYLYGLIKLRTYSDAQATDKTLGVSIPFRIFNIELLEENYEYNALGEEIEAVTEMPDILGDIEMEKFWQNPNNMVNYLLADVYIELIIKKDTIANSNSFDVPNNVHYRVAQLLRDNPDIYDEQTGLITIADINNLTLEERQCLLASRSGAISYNAFAAEVVAHARAAIIFRFIEPVFVYQHAKIADLSSSADGKEITDAIVELAFAYDFSYFNLIQRMKYGYK